MTDMNACMTRLAALALLLGASALAGCHSYLLPADQRAMPHRSAPTRGGDRLEADEGRLSVRKSSIAEALDVVLVEDEGGVLVDACLRDKSAFEPGDRILLVKLELPDRRGALHRASAPTATAIPARDPSWIPVRKLEDLDGFQAIRDVVHLDFSVVREKHRVIVCAEPDFGPRQLPVAAAGGAGARELGVEVCAVSDWPESLLPAHAKRDDMLVVRVSRDSALGMAGLRPLDVIVAGTTHRLGSPGLKPGTKHELKVRKPDGRERVLRYEAPREPVELWVPFLLSVQWDDRRTHVGLGPLDVLFHGHRRSEYDPATDSYATASGWSLGTVVQRGVERDGSGSKGMFHVEPLTDDVRLGYFQEWADAK